MFKAEQLSMNEAIATLGANAWTYTSEIGATGTLTVDQFVNGFYHQLDGGTPGTKTTPTAAAIVAGLYGAQVGSMFEFIVHNDDAVDTLTVAGGVGVTGNGTLTVAAGLNRRFVCVVPNIGTGTEAVEMFGLAQSV